MFFEPNRRGRGSHDGQAGRASGSGSASMCSAARCAREYRCRRWTTSAPPLLSRRRRWQRRHHVPLEQRLSVHHLPPQRRGESRLKKSRLRAERHGHLRRYVTVGGVLQHPLSLRHRRVPPPHLARGRADRGKGREQPRAVGRGASGAPAVPNPVAQRHLHRARQRRGQRRGRRDPDLDLVQQRHEPVLVPHPGKRCCPARLPGPPPLLPAPAPWGPRPLPLPRDDPCTIHSPPPTPPPPPHTAL